MGLVHKAIRLAKSIWEEERADLNITLFFEQRPWNGKVSFHSSRAKGGKDDITGSREIGKGEG